MYQDVNLLLVCTGNIFRSASAEYLLRQHLHEINEDRFNVGSAGTKKSLEKTMEDKTEQELRRRGVDASDHERTALREKHVEWADTIIAMADYHKETLYDEYKAPSHLYNEFTDHDTSNVDDIEDRYEDSEPSREQREKHIAETVAYLDDTIPTVTENLPYRHFLFREFALGDRDRHINGAPFKPLLENDEALAFLSLDIPDTLNNHVLVIPKDRYRDLHDIPLHIKQDMFELADTVSDVFNEKYGGYNTVVNTRGPAGQHIFHTHIHVIPREPNDAIDIEHWQHTTIEMDKHETYRKELVEAMNDY